MLVFPSMDEGFGLPVLEATAAGVLVVCASAAALPEVAGAAAEYFDPLSVGEMAREIARVALSPEIRETLKERGFNNVKRFSWVKAAEATLKVYREAVRGED
jgi:glycosyltransferase involved in cell wall biosynthesis